MFKSYYVLLLTDKKRLFDLYIKNIYIHKIKYQNNHIYLYVDEKNYKKIEKYSSIYNIKLSKIVGFNRYKSLIIKYRFFLISQIIALSVIVILSHVIFDINILTDNQDLKKIIEQELKDNNLSKYYFVKSFDKNEEIKNKILNDYKNKIEWLEIERIGTKYYIRVLERKINNGGNNDNYRNIVAKKNAIIMEIKSSKGEIIKKKYDYVNKGDVIISGDIKKNDEIKNKVHAEGIVYGETWYNVRVELPLFLHEKRFTGNSYDTITISFFNKRFNLFNKNRYLEEEYIDKPIISNSLLPISLNKTRIIEIKDITSISTYDIILERGMAIAKERLEKTLNPDAKIISQKKLKLYEENNIIVIDVFFVVYENITDYKEGE